MQMESKKFNIEITTSTIFKVLAVVIVLWLLYLIRDVVAILFFTIILVSILEPWVLWLTQKKLPKFLAVLLIYLVLVAFISIVVMLIIPPIVEQFTQLTTNFPLYWNKIISNISRLSTILSQYGIAQNIEAYLASQNFSLAQTGGLFSRVGSFFAGIFSLFIIMVITFYMLVQEGATKRILRSVLPIDYLPYAYQLTNKVQQKLGLWLRGQLILSFLVFLLVYFGLLILGVKYALILAIIAGILEFIPYLGPTFSGFIAIIITAFQSPIKAFFVLILYILIQIIENNILLPKVMQKAVGINPVISIFALLIGEQLGGLFGAILAIPVATAISAIVEDLSAKKTAEEIKLEE
ncbi:AI-2E family transporter [Candidatus Falkowbacteria bacterium]|nr:AI-2E family transporter [Candidatus Falkowbacteria bacterium]